MQFDIVGGSYKARFVAVNPRRTVNWYIHKQQLEQSDKYSKALYPFGGLESFTDLVSYGTSASVIYRLFNAKRLK